MNRILTGVVTLPLLILGFVALGILAPILALALLISVISLIFILLTVSYLEYIAGK